MAVLPLGAQNEVKDAEFRTITCRRINVVDGEGTVAVEIVTDEIDGGRVTVWNRDTMFSLAVMGTGGYGKESVFSLASMGVYKQNGVGSNAGGSAMISTNEHGGVGWCVWQG